MIRGSLLVSIYLMSCFAEASWLVETIMRVRKQEAELQKVRDAATQLDKLLPLVYDGMLISIWVDIRDEDFYEGNLKIFEQRWRLNVRLVALQMLTDVQRARNRNLTQLLNKGSEITHEDLKRDDQWQEEEQLFYFRLKIMNVR